MDDTAEKSSGHTLKVTLGQEPNIVFWINFFDVSREKLLKAVAFSGTRVEDVKSWIQLNK